MKQERLHTIKNKVICVGFLFGIILLLYFLCYSLIIGEKKVNVMDSLNITFVGENHEGKAVIQTEQEYFDQRINEFIASISYQVEPSENLSNGDKVLVSATWNEDLAKRYHLELEVPSTEIEVTGLSVPYEHGDELPSSFIQSIEEQSLAYMKDNATTIIENGFQQFHKNTEITLSSIEPCYQVFLTPKEDDKNRFITFYQVKAKGQVNTSDTGISLDEQEAMIYYAVTVQGINTSNTVQKEDIFASRVIGDKQGEWTEEDFQKYIQETYPNFDVEIVK